MKTNLSSPKPSWHDILAVDFVTPGSSSGWIDTDISAAVPSGSIAVLVYARGTQNLAAGCRALGAPATYASTFQSGSHSIPIVCGVVNGHIEIYDDALATHYYVAGYLI